MPPQYPCGIYDKDCRDNCFDCSGRVKWVHKRCVTGMTSSLPLSEWDKSGLQFPCTRCAYTDISGSLSSLAAGAEGGYLTISLR